MRDQCSVDGCERLHYGNTFCQMHYRRAKRNGHPTEHLNPPKPRPSTSELFWRKVAITPSCWLWNGANKDGYGMLRVNRTTVQAHRFAYEELVGAIPEGLVIDHLCRVHACVNPSHLEPVTNAENFRRGVHSTSGSSGRKACPHGHPYEGDNVMLVTRGTGKVRVCRTCDVARRLRNKDSDTARRRERRRALRAEYADFASADIAPVLTRNARRRARRTGVAA